ncbi:MAG: phosphatase PAP2 family protein, partial [Ignavibacteriales bacterium]|nr:phosphatase PAP2 family protein [Ignavibacteriales bacterium]
MLSKTNIRIYKHKINDSGFFDNFWQNIFNSFRGKYLILILASIAFTLLLVLSNWDKTIQDFFQAENPFGVLPPIILLHGNYWHLLIGFVIFYFGQSVRDARMIMLGFATIQAILSSFLVVSILKILSGRAAPLRPGGKSLYFLLRTDNPADFNFAFWENMTETLRLFWPSGHTAAVTAFVAAICAFYNEKIWIFVIGYIIVIITGLSMIDGDYHWTS